MSTVAQVAERCYREFLHPLDDQPAVARFASEVSRTATSWDLNLSTLSPEEQDLLAPGVLLEADDGELALIVDADLEVGRVEVSRAQQGTKAAKHAAGSLVTVQPMFSRAGVIEAVKDEVVDLYPDLHHVKTVEVTTSYDPIEVPADVITPIRTLIATGSRYVPVTADLMSDFPPSSTGKAIILRQTADGLPAYFTYRARFTRPMYASDELSDYGVDPAWEQIVAVGAAARAVSVRVTDQLSAEYLTEALEREALENDAPGDIQDRLRLLRAVLVDRASRQLLASETPVVIHQPLGPVGL